MDIAKRIQEKDFETLMGNAWLKLEFLIGNWEMRIRTCHCKLGMQKGNGYGIPNANLEIVNKELQIERVY